ncbi:hypothetical protein FisN_12Lh369 [Fistulifera solaris]|uniref:Ran guanine nucleotide release factor n=1 Tax=Fistulifera solaris TaxID=1519565 RepID=A0A1Z5JLS6_FISSO|nr:hypothetical protein FisN_12Lh369 [Fistulifera solaris]|eukprot:GAX14929.1 hypothetical protein FisN_12Lh369 [Fistulifera solaris]
MVLRQLFGGSIECKVPEGWRDVSDIRQVPDHQECWQDDQGNLLVIEILDYQTDVTDDQAARYFFQDLAESNGVINPQDVSFAPSDPSPIIAGLPPTAVLCTGSGSQRMSQGRERVPQPSDPIWIHVELCAIRLPTVSTDILITLTSPAASNPQADGNGTKPSLQFQAILASFCIRDWSLFGP